MNSTNPVKRRYVDGKYGQIHLRIVEAANSNKSPVICLHLSPKSGWIYQDIMPCLAQERTVIAPDYPGFGESDPPPAEPPVAISDYAEMIWQVVNQSAAYPVHLIGYHTGSYVAVEAARQEPDRVKSIINISAPIFTDEELTGIRQTYSHIPLDEAGTRFRHMWQELMYWRGPGMTLENAARSLAENLRAGENYEWGHRAAFDYAHDYVERIQRLDQPVLVINPNDDLTEHSRRVDSLLKNGERRDFPQWGHGFLSAYPGPAAKVMLDFINSVEPG